MSPIAKLRKCPARMGNLASVFCLAASARFPFSLWMCPARRASRLLAWSSLKITVVCHDDLDASDKGKKEIYTQDSLKISDDGVVEVPLKNEGTYLLSELKVTVDDRAGNKSDPISIDAFFGTSGFDRVSVDDPNAAAKDTFDIEVNSDGLSGADRYYHNDTVTVTLWGKGWRFELFRHTLAFRSAVSASCESWKGKQELAGYNNQPEFTFNKNKDRWEAELRLFPPIRMVACRMACTASSSGALTLRFQRCGTSWSIQPPRS